MTWLDKDRALSARLSVIETSGWRRRLAILVTRSGDAPYLLAIMGLLVAFGAPEWRYRALMLLLVDLFNLIVTLLVKVISRRARPKGRWGRWYRKTDPNSFPSGHASRGGAIGTAGLLLGPPWFGLLLVGWGVSVAFSRVATGVHYVSDVVAGFALGALMGGLLTLLV